MRAILFVMIAVTALVLLVSYNPSGPRDLDSLYVFGKHDSTGLCFFGEDWDSDGLLDAGTAGHVPCTPEVEKSILDHRRIR